MLSRISVPSEAPCLAQLAIEKVLCLKIGSNSISCHNFRWLLTINNMVSLIQDVVDPDTTNFHCGAHTFLTTPHSVRKAPKDARSSCPVNDLDVPVDIISSMCLIPCVVKRFGVPAPRLEAEA
jgi:hypothetical protein